LLVGDADEFLGRRADLLAEPNAIPLLVRERYAYTRWWARLIVEPAEVISLVMSQKMLRGIKDRAEALGGRISLHIPPGACNPDASTVFPQAMRVDYVRVYTFNPPLGATVTLRSLANQKYVTAGDAPLIADGASAGAAGQFQVLEVGGGAVALKALVNGLYVSAVNSTTPLIANIDLAVFAPVRPGTALTVEQKREFIRGAMVAGGQDWARDMLRLPVDIVPLDYWSAGMVEKAFAAVWAAEQMA